MSSININNKNSVLQIFSSYLSTTQMDSQLYLQHVICSTEPIKPFAEAYSLVTLSLLSENTSISHTNP